MSESPMAMALGRFSNTFRYDDLPEVERERVKVRLLYLIGTVFAARDHEGSRLALGLSDKLADQGPSSVWLTAARGTAEECAFVNSVLSHAGLLDDTPVHTGAIVIPAALAVAEAEASTGAETLASIALGYELVLRLDLPLSNGNTLGGASHQKGFRHSWFAVFGAAAAAGYLLGLSAEGMADALALTTTLSVPGAMAWSRSTMSDDERLERGVDIGDRYLQIAANAKQGVFAAGLARCGYRGTRTAFEGDAGLYSIYTGLAEVPGDLLTGLGETWHLDTVGVKPYPGAGYTTSTYCAEKIARDHAPRVEDIERIEARIAPWGAMPGMADTGPFARVEHALGSCPFAVAATLVFGQYDWDVIDRALGDRRVDELARRVDMVGISSPTDARYSELTVRLRDGTSLVADSSDMPDSMAHLSDWAGCVKRFHELAKYLPVGRREQVVREVRELDEREDCTSLLAAISVREDGAPHRPHRPA